MSHNQIYEIFVRASQQQVWSALTEGQQTVRYFFGTAVSSDFQVGSRVIYTSVTGELAVEGRILVANPPNKLVHTWRVLYDPGMSHEESQVTWLIETRGAACKLSLIHDLVGAPLVAEQVANEGWILVLSSLKTLLETGEPLVVD
jgi:uncharacterized protein YndB with AHSA1/START domain